MDPSNHHNILGIGLGGTTNYAQCTFDYCLFGWGSWSTTIHDFDAKFSWVFDKHVQKGDKATLNQNCEKKSAAISYFK